MKDLTIVYMVAGISSRFGGKAKPLTIVGPNGETLIEYSMNQALKYGFNKIIFIVSQKTIGMFKAKFGDSYKGIPIQYALQEYDEEKRGGPWGTCDAVCSAINLIKEPFVVCTGDEIYGEKTFGILVDHLKSTEDDATIAQDLIKMIPKSGTVNRGIFETDENNYVITSREIMEITRENLNEKGLKENDPTSVSLFALHPITLSYLKYSLDNFKEKNKDNRNAECYLNTELSKLIKEGKIKIKLYKTPEKWLGITNPEDEQTVKNLLKNTKKETHKNQLK